MKFSERILKVKPSPTLAVTALANSMKAQGIDVIGFGSGEPDFDTPSHIKSAAIDAINAGKTKYTPAGGINELKKAIVDKFKHDNGLDYEISQVSVNVGGKHSFYNLMQVLLNEGDEVIIPAPYWVSYPPMTELAGGKPVIIETKEKNGFRMTPEELKNALSPKTVAVVINSPSNPTGSCYTKDELLKIAEVLEGTKVLIISDDIYESIIYDDTKFYNIAMLSEKLREQTIVLNGVSKTYSMTGWRIGYMGGKAEIIKKVEVLQSQSTSNPTSISQWAAVAALTGDQSVIQEMVVAFAERRKIILEKLNSMPGVSCLSPNGAFYVFPNISGVFKLPGWDAAKKKYEGDSNSNIFSSYLLEEAKVAVVPGIAFGSDDNIRISFATSEENIRNGMERIGKAINKLA